MTIKVFIVGYIQTNCYVVFSQQQKEAAIIDPGGGYNRISAFLKSVDKIPAAVLLTHGHFDHTLAAAKFQKDGAKIYIHSADNEMAGAKQGLASKFGLCVPKLVPDILFEDQEIIKVGDIEFKVIHTPGHSKGSSCFVCQDCIFGGDTLFFESYGRTDFYGGSMTEMAKSLKKLFDLPGDYKVYPGHGESTSLSHERIHNPLA